jgi:hypothetical protein
LCSRDGRVRHSIPYPHAGLWALIAAGKFNRDSATELMSILMSVDRQEAEHEIEATLSVWSQLGFIAGD